MTVKETLRSKLTLGAILATLILGFINFFGEKYLYPYIFHYGSQKLPQVRQLITSMTLNDKPRPHQLLANTILNNMPEPPKIAEDPRASRLQMALDFIQRKLDKMEAHFKILKKNVRTLKPHSLQRKRLIHRLKRTRSQLNLYRKAYLYLLHRLEHLQK